MNGKQLKNSILQWAIQGKLVPQDPNDEPASVLLKRIRKEKERLVKEKKIKKDKNASIIFRGEDNSYYEKFLATGEVKCIDEEIPFEIPALWVWCKISDVCIMQAGKNIAADKIFPEPTETHPYRCVGGNGLRGYVADFNTEGNHAIVGRQGALCGCLNIEIGNFYATEHAVVVNSYGNIHYKFMYWFLMALNLNKLATATAQPGLSVAKVMDSYFPLPPLSEQQRIITRIEELMPFANKFDKAQISLNVLNSSMNELLKKSILQEAIQGKLVPQIVEEGTAQELLEQIKQEKQKLVKEGKQKKSALTDSVIFKGDDNKYYEQMGTKCIDISESIPFEVPIGWCWTRLSVISNLYTGNSISETEKATRYTNVQGMEYIGTKDVSFNHVVNYANGIAIPNEHISQFKIAPSRSVLLCIEGGSAGRKIAQIEKNVCFGNKLCCFVPYVMATSKYIYFYLQSPSFFENFRGNIAGIIGGVSVNTLKSLLIPLPPIKEQKRIVAQIEKLFGKLK
ncbi:MAG: restriction endonuclease subunit S [Prevotella sp.]|nr:restriction endonuclease subunit S [Prevotella sp.]